MPRSLKVVLLGLVQWFVPWAGYVYETPGERRRIKLTVSALGVVFVAAGAFISGLLTGAVVFAVFGSLVGILFAVDRAIANRTSPRDRSSR